MGPLLSGQNTLAVLGLGRMLKTGLTSDLSPWKRKSWSKSHYFFIQNVIEFLA